MVTAVEVFILLLDVVIVVMAAGLGALNAYQAITGRRLSKKPSTRTDRQMRTQSAVAAVALLGVTVVLVSTALL